MTVLLLAGTAEAKVIAQELADQGVPVLASLAGATRQPAPLGVPTRIGGFGGEHGFRALLSSQAVSGVLDATHPFANAITDRTARICAELDLPYAQVVRPAWEPGPKDRWTMISAPEDASHHIPQDATVFLATGRQTVARFAGLEGRRILLRVIDPPEAPLPFEGGEFVIGRPPFSAPSEEALFEALGVTHLVAKNAGGTGGRAKLDAAANLGVPVLMLKRPAMPGGMRLTSVAAAVQWVRQL